MAAQRSIDGIRYTLEHGYYTMPSTGDQAEADVRFLLAHIEEAEEALRTTESRELSAARIQELEAALRLAAETIRGLAEQQAMPDDIYRATLVRIDEVLS